jgi:hypothetical protein
MAKMTKRGFPHLRQQIFDLWKIPAKKPKVFARFLEWSTLSKKAAERALMPWSGPDFLVQSLLSRGGGYADFPGISDFIWLSKIFAGQFELTQPNYGGHHQARLLMESVLLHELVHWGYWKTHGRLEPLKPERGWEFVKSAYGAELTATSLGIRAFIAVPGNR